MDKVNFTISKTNSKDLKESECYKIEGLILAKCSHSEIAKLLNRSLKTIKREIARGTVTFIDSELRSKIVYSAYHSCVKRSSSRRRCGRKPKLSSPNAFFSHVRTLLRKKYSPDAIIGEAKYKGLFPNTIVCTKTLYNYIYKGYFNDIIPKRKKRKKGKQRTLSYKLPNRLSIDERPLEAINREFGHWEIDCVCSGRGGEGALLTLVERNTRYAIIRKLKSQTQECVTKAIDSIERTYKGKFSNVFRSIVSDNGSEFLNYKKIETSCFNKDKKRTTIYYAYPNAAWQRGSNENLNGIIRRFIKKGGDISKYSVKQINDIQLWINTYQRKILNYKNANAVFKYRI